MIIVYTTVLKFGVGKMFKCINVSESLLHSQRCIYLIKHTVKYYNLKDFSL